MLVLKCGIDPRYVMDEMPLYEADLYLSRAYYVAQELREDLRMVTWATCQVNTKRHIKPSDIYQLPWERERNEPEPAPDLDIIKQLQQKGLKRHKQRKANG